MIEHSEMSTWRSSASIQFTDQLIYTGRGQSMSLETTKLEQTCWATDTAFIRILHFNTCVLNTVIQRDNYKAQSTSATYDKCRCNALLKNN